MIRELHVYGDLKPINFNKDKSKEFPEQYVNQDDNRSQHQGLGKFLILTAEKIAKEDYNCSKLAIIAGTGVIPYYAKRGYTLSSPGRYMIKNLN